MSMFALFQLPEYHPHGFCYLWESDLVWTHVLGDGFTALAYYSIPVGLVYVTRKRRDIPFDWLFVAFAAFILACGTTHVMAIWNLWHADFWAAAWVKVATAGASIATALLLIPAIPRIVELPSPTALLEKNVQLAAAHAEIAELNRELEARVAQLETANADLRTFSHSISHDLKAPLRAMSGFSTAIAEDCGNGLSDECRGYVQRVIRGSERLSRLIDDLLSYGQLALRPMESERVALRPLLDEVLSSMRRTIEETGASVDVTVDTETVGGHASTLSVALANLLENALKYVEPGRAPVVRIRAWQAEHRVVRISVADNGIGIAPEDRGRVFELFERLHGVDSYGGTGVGLAVVAKAVERLGGRVSVESRVGEGSEFLLDLPTWEPT